MLRLIFATSLVIAAVLIAAGCGDDDCASCPSNVDTVTMTETITDTITVTDSVPYDGPKVLVSGFFRVEDNLLDPWLEIISTDGNMPVVDSVVGAGEVMPSRIVYSNGTPYIQLDDRLSGNTWESGDTLEITVYTPQGSATCNARCLDKDADAPVFIDWSDTYPHDTVDIDDEIVVQWQTVQGADWYNYYWSHQYDSAGQRRSHFTWGYTSDTSVTIDNDDNGFNGYWDFYLYPIAGPHPEDAEGNFVGSPGIRGVLLSYTYGDLTIYVGTGDPGDWAVSMPTTGVDPQDQMKDLLSSLKYR